MSSSLVIRRLLFSLLLLTTFAATTVVLAAPPTLRDVIPRGATIGKVTSLRLTGANLQDQPRLVSAHLPIAEQKIESSSANECVISVSLPADTPAGIYSVRVATSQGISSPILIGVDELPQERLVAGSDLESPVALTGSLTGSTIVEAPFNGKKGERIVIDVESRRLAGKLNPLLRLVDERDTQIAWSDGQGLLAGDARIETILPADGRYRVLLHDKLYRGAAPGYFRLKIGDLHFANYALPLGVTVGQDAKLNVFGDDAAEYALATMRVPVEAPLVNRRRVPAGSKITGDAPTVFVTEHAELLEPPLEEGQQFPLSAAPVAVSGRLAKSGETDRYQLPVKPGDKLRLELHSARLGMAIDGVIDVLRQNGQRLAGNDDQPGSSDPRVDFTVPGGVDMVTIAVRDMLGRGGDDFVYRLTVSQLGQPDFTLAVDQPTLELPVGQVALVRVTAQRSGYQGPIQIILHGLPPSVKVSGAEIAAGSNEALLTLVASEQPGAGTGIVAGRSVGESTIRRVAHGPASDVTTAHPRLAAEIGWAVTPAGPVQLTWQLAEDSILQLGDRIAVPVKVMRTETTKGDVRLSLLTDQVVPKKTVKNEKTKKDEVIDDLDRTFRLEGKPTVAADASEGTIHILTPPDAPNRKWNFILKGELLAADKKSVVATTFTSLRSIKSNNPLRLELTTSEAVEAKAGLGETGKVRGVVHREEGFNHPVRIMLAGLPAGYQSEPLAVPANTTEFEYPIRFQFGAKAGDLKNVRVVATARLDPENAARSVRSNAVPLAIKVVAGEKPPE